MASLANNSKDEKEQMNIAHEKLTFLLNMFNDTNMPLQELLTNIQSKVDDLDDVAKQIVGGVVGVEKEKVNGAIKELTVEGFFTLRDQFHKMGI